MNKIEIIEKDDFEKLLNVNSNNCYIVIIDGKENKDWNSYKDTIESKFKFPTKNNNYDGYSDWMRDLSWLESKSFMLFIFNYREFLSEDLECKKVIMNMFQNTILPWWSEDVEKYVVCGEKKDFNIFIVE